MTLVNTKAPDFTLLDQDEKEHSIKDYRGKIVLLYFYPKDMTPGCTVEALGFRDTLNDLKALDVQVLGVSADTCGSHKKFAQKHQLNFPLLADTDKKVINAYGVLKEKSMYGKKYMGISRESFLIDQKGKIVKHYEKVTPANHPAEVITDVKNFSL
jgi:peroxiredoxin Q/BCP